MIQPALQLTHVSKTFRIHKIQLTTLKERLFNIFRENKQRTFKAVDDVSLEIMPGEILGLIGRNGSGKSTLVKIMSGAFIPDEGGTIIRKGTSMLLNLSIGISHELTARQNIYVCGSTLGLRTKQIDKLFDKILAFAELENFADTKIKYFSSGMVQRLSFSIAINVQADIMFLDEVFAVGDEPFRKKAIAELEKSWMNGRTVILVSHSMEIISQYCHRVLYLRKGKIAFLGDPKTAIQQYYADNELAETVAAN